MADNTACESLDVDKVFTLKVDELKSELAKRGLPKSGNKSELQVRLLEHVSDVEDDVSGALKTDEVDEITEDEELKKEIEESLKELSESSSQPTADITLSDTILDEAEVTKESLQKSLKRTHPIKNVLKDLKPTVSVKELDSAKIAITPLTEKERKENRSKRFGGAVNEIEKKKSRLERFSTSSDTSDSKSKLQPEAGVDKDKTSKRVERFGAVSLNKNSGSDRLKQRQERFGDVKIKKRQERFGVVQPINPSSAIDVRKQQRALKFGIK